MDIPTLKANKYFTCVQNKKSRHRALGDLKRTWREGKTGLPAHLSEVSRNPLSFRKRGYVKYCGFCPFLRQIDGVHYCAHPRPLLLLNEKLRKEGQPSQGNIKLKLVCRGVFCRKKRPIQADGCFKQNSGPVSTQNSQQTIGAGYHTSVV